MHVQTIKFNEKFWEDEMLPKLVTFYKKAMLPEMLTDRVKRGLKL